MRRRKLRKLRQRLKGLLNRLLKRLRVLRKLPWARHSVVGSGKGLRKEMHELKLHKRMKNNTEP